jgi:bis(5'-nucleosyl)-tetraphosphatase (symmetrical)
LSYLNNDSSLNLKKKDLLPSKELSPWFNLLEEDSLAPNEYIVFGHWASLNGQTNIKNIIGLDTGCVWGGSLTALRLEDMKIFSVQKK